MRKASESSHSRSSSLGGLSSRSLQKETKLTLRSAADERSRDAACVVCLSNAARVAGRKACSRYPAQLRTAFVACSSLQTASAALKLPTANSPGRTTEDLPSSCGHAKNSRSMVGQTR